MGEVERPTSPSSKESEIFRDRSLSRSRCMDDLPAQVTQLSAVDKESFLGKIVTAQWFENCALAIIIGNAAWIGFELEWNEPGGLPPQVFFVGDNVFCVLFSIELLLRIMSYRRIHWFVTAPNVRWWNLLDIWLVLMMITETWVLAYVNDEDLGINQLSILRLLRLLRLTRIFRLVPELGMMAKSLFEAFRAVASGGMLMLMLMYVFAIILTQWGKSEGIAGYCDDGICMTTYFGTIGFSMLSLGQVVTYDNCFELIRPVLFKDFFHGCALILFMCVGGFMVLNMLLGVICSVISERNLEEKERMFRQRAEEELGFAESQEREGSPQETQKSEEEEKRGRMTVVQQLSSVGFHDEHVTAICDLYGKSFYIADDWRDIDKREVTDLAFKLRRPLQTIDVLDTLRKADLAERRFAARAIEEVDGTGESRQKEGQRLSRRTKRLSSSQSQATQIFDQINERSEVPSKAVLPLSSNEQTALNRLQAKSGIKGQVNSQNNSELYKFLAKLDQLALGRLDKIDTLGDHIQALAATMSPSRANIPKRSFSHENMQEDTPKRSGVQDLAEFVRHKLEHIRHTVDAQRARILKMEAHWKLQASPRTALLELPQPVLHADEVEPEMVNLLTRGAWSADRAVPNPSYVTVTSM